MPKKKCPRCGRYMQKTIEDMNAPSWEYPHGLGSEQVELYECFKPKCGGQGIEAI